MDSFKYVIVGGGMVAGHALKEMAKGDLAAGEAALVSADTVPPYNRPPLSKDFLEGTRPVEKVFINKDPFYEEHGVALRLNTAVAALDLPAGRVRLGDGEEIGYEQLLLATGSSVRRLEVPGAGLEGVQYLRGLDSCVELKQRAAEARRLVVVGGGFIGCECAARLAAQGLETTIVYREDALLDFFLPPPLCALYEERFRSHNVTLVPGAQVTGLTGTSRVEGVQLAGGDLVPGDLVLVAVGVTPAVDLAAAAGLNVAKGVLVDEFLQTSAPGVYAAGDVSEYYDPYLGQHRHVEHEDHARRSGAHAGRALLGNRAPYDYLALVWSDVYDISWEFYGESRGADRVVYRGDVPGAHFSAWWLAAGKLIGAMVCYDWTKTEGVLAQQWIKEGRSPDPAVLEDSSVELG
jgi:3-phenylpropionate/trans-cinnamate dioxygenase ferredoxin reductase component